mgnify:CR=1 FL=1
MLFPTSPHFVYLCSEYRSIYLFCTKRKSMRISSLLALSSWCLFGLFGAVSCDDLSAEPEVSPSYVEIPAEGGEAMTQLKQVGFPQCIFGSGSRCERQYSARRHVDRWSCEVRRRVVCLLCFETEKCNSGGIVAQRKPHPTQRDFLR